MSVYLFGLYLALRFVFTDIVLQSASSEASRFRGSEVPRYRCPQQVTFLIPMLLLPPPSPPLSSLLKALMGGRPAPQGDTTAEPSVQRPPLGLQQITPKHSVPTVRARSIAAEGSARMTGDLATLLSNISILEDMVAEIHAGGARTRFAVRRRCRPGYGVCYRHYKACSRSTGSSQLAYLVHRPS